MEAVCPLLLLAAMCVHCIASASPSCSASRIAAHTVRWGSSWREPATQPLLCRPHAQEAVALIQVGGEWGAGSEKDAILLTSGWVDLCLAYKLGLSRPLCKIMTTANPHEYL